MEKLYQTTIKIPNHAKERARQRGNKSKRNIQLALERGYDYSDFSGSFRRYLDKIRFNKRYRKYLKIYANDIYIFDEENNSAVTVLNIPSKYLKSLEKEKLK